MVGVRPHLPFGGFMQGEELPFKGKVKKARLVKYENDENGDPIRDEPLEIWEGENESNMKLIYKRED
jgi:hypothetical protein